jgi:UTP-glucose-1-phosphate uridylyltransferase
MQGVSQIAQTRAELGFARQPDALGVGEAVGFATELFQENAILFLEVFDHSLLVSAHPAGDCDEQELELRRHRVENLSKVLVAQYSIGSRLNFLAVQADQNVRRHLF